MYSFVNFLRQFLFALHNRSTDGWGNVQWNAAHGTLVLSLSFVANFAFLDGFLLLRILPACHLESRQTFRFVDAELRRHNFRLLNRP